MYITECLGIPKGHKTIDFIDITTAHDTRLFIDPCLIERGLNPLSRTAADLIADFTDTMYNDMRYDRWQFTEIFNEAHEVHATKLGYGNGSNGKGKTPSGMRNSLYGLCTLAKDIPSISTIQDIPTLVEDFAEDCMSDLLTNILRRVLCKFTAEQMEYYGKKPAGNHKIKYWDKNRHGWSATYEPYWLVEGQKILLVPKQWVRKRFIFTAHHYLYTVIIDRIRETEGYENLAKLDIWKNLKRESKHWEYDTVIDYTTSNVDALNDYHGYLHKRYDQSSGCMADDKLDQIVYGNFTTKLS